MARVARLACRIPVQAMPSLYLRAKVARVIMVRVVAYASLTAMLAMPIMVVAAVPPVMDNRVVFASLTRLEFAALQRCRT